MHIDREKCQCTINKGPSITLIGVNAHCGRGQGQSRINKELNIAPIGEKIAFCLRSGSLKDNPR